MLRQQQITSIYLMCYVSVNIRSVHIYNSFKCSIGSLSVCLQYVCIYLCLQTIHIYVYKIVTCQSFSVILAHSLAWSSCLSCHLNHSTADMPAGCSCPLWQLLCPQLMNSFPTRLCPLSPGLWLSPPRSLSPSNSMDGHFTHKGHQPVLQPLQGGAEPVNW